MTNLYLNLFNCLSSLILFEMSICRSHENQILIRSTCAWLEGLHSTWVIEIAAADCRAPEGRSFRSCYHSRSGSSGSRQRGLMPHKRLSGNTKWTRTLPSKEITICYPVYDHNDLSSMRCSSSLTHSFSLWLTHPLPRSCLLVMNHSSSSTNGFILNNI